MERQAQHVQLGRHATGAQPSLCVQARTWNFTYLQAETAQVVVGPCICFSQAGRGQGEKMPANNTCTTTWACLRYAVDAAHNDVPWQLPASPQLDGLPLKVLLLKLKLLHCWLAFRLIEADAGPVRE